MRFGIRSRAARASLLVGLAIASAPVDAGAQVYGDGGGPARLTERHEWGDPEGRLMAYYSAALAFSPVGAPRTGAAPWSAHLGVEVSYLPPLSAAQRSAGFSKTESTNLLPVVPRPRLVATLPAGLALEASWIPPVRFAGVKANLISAAVARSFGVGRGVLLTPRVAGTTGSVRAPITCNDELRRQGEGDSLFFARVCHGIESDDRFEPQAISGELIASRADGVRGLAPYAGLGVRVERDRFDVGVRYANGTMDPNHPILALHLTRPYGFIGATWGEGGRSALGAELFYAPRSVLTARVQVSLRLVGGR